MSVVIFLSRDNCHIVYSGVVGNGEKLVLIPKQNARQRMENRAKCLPLHSKRMHTLLVLNKINKVFLVNWHIVADKKKSFGAPGWLSRLSIRLQLRSRSRGL